MTDIREELARAIANASEDAAKHIDGVDSLWPHYLDEADALLPIIERRIAAARKEERERCAMVVEGGASGPCAEDVQAGAAAALRALGDK